MNVQAGIGHNIPPTRIDEIQAEYSDTFLEVENWLDGAIVENEGQMKAVDALLKEIKNAEKDAKAGKEIEYRPHKLAGDSIVAKWKPFIDDLGMQKAGLIKANTPFKNKLAAEKVEAERVAREKANAARLAAVEASKAAVDTNIETQREAAELTRKAQEAQADVATATKDKVKGLRKQTTVTVADYDGLLEWIKASDMEALRSFMDEYAPKAHRAGAVLPSSVSIVTEKVAL